MTGFYLPRKITPLQWTLPRCARSRDNRSLSIHSPMGGKTIDILEAKSEMRSAFMGGFAGRFVSSLIRLIAAALGNWHFIFQEDLFLTPYEDAEYAPPPSRTLGLPIAPFDASACHDYHGSSSRIRSSSNSSTTPFRL